LHKKGHKETRGRCKQNRKIPIGAKQGQNQHAENHISGVDHTLQELSRRAGRKTTDSKESTGGNENKHLGDVTEIQPRQVQQRKKSKWGRNANQDTTEKNTYVLSLWVKKRSQ
jgi:hypothetical protein